MFSSPFSMVVAIVFIGCLYGLADSWLKTRRKEAELSGQPGDDETRNRIEQLEHRVRVLERIVTDSGDDLRREIDRL